MGGGQRFIDDVKRRGGADLLEAAKEVSSGLEASGGPLASSEEFCGREHRLAFCLTNGTTPSLGEAVSLLAGEPLQLVGAQGPIGVIQSDRSDALNKCLGNEWRLNGRVMRIDTTTGRGVALLAGEH